MPKRKDKSFQLMASIGEAKNVPEEAPKLEKSVTKEQSQKKPVRKKVENIVKAPTSNIPYIPPSISVKKQLKKLAFEEETSMTALISEGLNYVFKERGLKTIGELIEEGT
jgi:hypothetical protein